MRETAQRQADGASKAEQRIQLAVRCVGWHVRLQNSGWLSVAAADALSLLVRPRR